MGGWGEGPRAPSAGPEGVLGVLSQPTGPCWVKTLEDSRAQGRRLTPDSVSPESPGRSRQKFLGGREDPVNPRQDAGAASPASTAAHGGDGMSFLMGGKVSPQYKTLESTPALPTWRGGWGPEGARQGQVGGQACPAVGRSWAPAPAGRTGCRRRGRCRVTSPSSPAPATRPRCPLWILSRSLHP